MLGMVGPAAAATCIEHRTEDCRYVIECDDEPVICVVNVDDESNLSALRQSEVIEDQAVQIENLVSRGFAARQIIIGSKASRYISGIGHVARPFTLVMWGSRRIGFLHDGLLADNLTPFAEYMRDGGKRPAGEPFIRLVKVRLRTELCGKRL